jgi:hypothetical protein
MNFDIEYNCVIFVGGIFKPKSIINAVTLILSVPATFLKERLRFMLLHIKTAAIGLAALLTMSMATGCAVISTDISELEVPPKLTEEQQAIESALESSVGSTFTLKYPLGGNYRSAFILRNLGKSSTSEALAFYSPASGAEGPHIAILDKVDGSWKVTTDISNEGNEIDSIEFGDYNGDGNDEIAVGWRSFNSTDLTLVVYTKNKSSYSSVKLGTFTEMKTLDMDNDGKEDILLFQLDSDPSKARARLISYKGGELTEIASSPLDSTVTSYAGVYVTKLDAKEKGVLIDGYKSESKMITELVYYKNGKLISPLYNTERHTVNSTMRYVTYKCTDINNDGIMEIPMPVELPYVPNEKDTNQNWLVRWSVFNSKSGFTTKLSAVMNYTKNYYFTYPEKWGADVTVSKQSGDSIWNFCKWNKTKNSYGTVLFSIYVYNEDEWDALTNKNEYSILIQRNGTVYTVKIPTLNSKEPLALSLSDIKKNFDLLN